MSTFHHILNLVSTHCLLALRDPYWMSSCKAIWYEYMCGFGCVRVFVVNILHLPVLALVDLLLILT